MAAPGFNDDYLMLKNNTDKTALHFAANKNLAIVNKIIGKVSKANLIKLLLIKSMNKSDKLAYMAVDIAFAAGQDAIVSILLNNMIPNLIEMADKYADSSNKTSYKQEDITSIAALFTIAAKYAVAMAKNNIDIEKKINGLTEKMVSDSHPEINNAIQHYKNFSGLTNQNISTAFNKEWNGSAEKKMLIGWAMGIKDLPTDCISLILNECVKNKDIGTLCDFLQTSDVVKAAGVAWQEPITNKTLLHIIVQNIQMDDIDETDENSDLLNIIKTFKIAKKNSVSVLDVQDNIGRTALSYVAGNEKSAEKLIILFLDGEANFEVKDKNNKTLYDYASDNLKNIINRAQLTYYNTNMMPDKHKDVVKRICSNEKTIKGCLDWSNNEATLYTLVVQLNQDLTLLKKCINAALDKQFLTYISNNQNMKDGSSFDELVDLYPLVANEWAKNNLEKKYGTPKNKVPGEFLDLVEALNTLDTTYNMVTKAEPWTIDSIQVNPWTKDGKTAQQIYDEAPNKKQESVQVPAQASAPVVSKASKFASLGSRIMNHLKGLVLFS